MNEDLDKLVREFIDGDLTDEQEVEALYRMAADPEARKLLRFDRHLRESLVADRASQPPAGFAARTMAAIKADVQQEETVASHRPNWLQRIRDVLTTPRAVTLRPAYALALAAIVIVSVSLFRYQTASGPVATKTVPATSSNQVVQPVAEVTEIVGARFVYIDDNASSVAVAGDFSRWQPVPLQPQEVDGQRIWSAVIPLSKGEHQYMFVINGTKWVTDPLAPIQREDGFGHRNAVIIL